MNGFFGRWALPLLAVVAMACAGCGGEDTDFQSVRVVYGETSVEVDLADIDPVDIGDGAGEAYAPLDEVVAEADLGVALEDLVFDFAASDGFQASNSSSCADVVPVPGARLAQGYIHRETRQLVWDDDLGYPRCLEVDDTAEILAEDASAVPRTVEVVYDGTSAEVDLSTLDTVDVGGEDLVLLADVVEAADLGVATEDLVFDFVASDGFRPGDSSNCVGVVPLAGSALSSGWIDPVTRDISWDAALDLPGCMGVDDVATIEAEDAPVAGRTVEVTYGETTETVDLSTLATEDVDGVPMVPLDDVVAAASLGVALEDLAFDFVASDGFRPGDSSLCTDLVPVAGADLASGWIDPATGDLAWDDALAFPGCLSVGDVVTFEATDALTPRRIVDVVYESASHVIDLTTLATEDVEGVPMVPLDDVVAAASLGVDTATLDFDFVASDGFRPGDSSGCTSFVPVPGSSLASGWIDPDTGDLEWDAALSYPGCLAVHDVVTIEATSVD